MKEHQLRLRDYQQEGKTRLNQHFISHYLPLLKGALYENLSRPTPETESSEAEKFPLIHMATGAGKTFTVNQFVNDLFRWRALWVKYGKLKTPPPLHFLILNDRQSLINQLKEDMIDGREGKAPFISKTFTEGMKVEVLHSGVNSSSTRPKPHAKSSWDSITFATFQTAKLHPPLTRPNVIIVDEAHHLSAEDYYQTFLQYYQPDAEGNYPLTLLMTATPDKIKHLSTPIVDFGLAQWIASPHSPEVAYHFVPAPPKQEVDTLPLAAQISKGLETSDPYQQLTSLLSSDETLQQLLSTQFSREEMIEDLRKKGILEWPSIIFCNSIAELERIASLLRSQHVEAEPFHSQRSSKDNEQTLQSYSQKKTQVILAVGKLNEGIDLPATKHVVFWRDTQSSDVFRQQFGRSLRGDGKVHVRDYQGGIKNLDWIEQINREIDQLPESKRTKKQIELNVESSDEWFNHLIPARNRLKYSTDHWLDSLPSVDFEGKVLIDEKSYLWPSASNIPSSDALFWMRDTKELSSILLSWLHPQGRNYDPSRVAQHVRYAKVPSKQGVEAVVDFSGIQEALLRYLQHNSVASLGWFPLIWADGTVEIHGQRYVSLDLSFERIPGMPGFSTQEIKKKVAEMPASWKASYGKTALRISPASKKVSRSSVPQQVYALDALQERFYPHLDHRKQVRIEGQEYLALNPQSFPALKNADPSWKKKYRRYAWNPLTRSLRTVFTTTGLVELGIPLPENTSSVKKEINTQVRMRKRKHAS